MYFPKFFGILCFAQKERYDFMHNSQEVSNIIKSYAKSKKIAIGKMLSDCNLSKNTLSSMQSGGYLPRAETLIKIADYLDCSVDYLLGRTDNPEVNK